MFYNRILLFAIGFCLAFTSILAQPPADKLNKWGNDNLIEKLYLHLDREDYVAGQTLWFKAYLFSGFQANDKSTAVFVELLTANSGLISRLSLPVIRSVSQGQFDLPDSLSGGSYIIRAYTATMLNQDPEFIYKRTITVVGRKSSIVAQPATGMIRMEFFPEGGNFVTGLSNTIAFKASDENGWPIDVKGEVKNAKGEPVATFTSLHDGMGMFDIDAATSEKYYVELFNDPSKKYEIPVASARGVVFRLMHGNDGIHFEILQQKNDPIYSAAYMIGQIQHNVVFKQPLKAGVPTLTGVIKTENLLSGILQITIFNKDGQPLAERLSFVNNKEYLLDGKIQEDTTNFAARGRNRLTISLPDTIVGSFSVSVTDPEYNSSSSIPDHIISHFLLSSDLKGYIHKPAYYFSSEDDSVKSALDLVMMTNGWRRFKWEQLLKDGMTANKFTDPGFVTLAGRVTLEGTKKPFASKELLVMIAGADSSRNMQLIRTDENGYYKADSLLFFGPANILFSDIRGKKSQFLDIKPAADSLNRFYLLPKLDQSWPLAMRKQSNGSAYPAKMVQDYESIMKSSGIVLSEIIVKSKKKSALQEIEDKYTTGAFSGDTRKTFDLVNSTEAEAYTNIFDYLTARVPGLNVGRTEFGDYYAYFRQTATVSSMGNQGMDIFLDEVLTDANTVAYIPPSQIAMVKVYSNFVGSTGGGAGGALAIYMKKGSDLFNALPSAGEMIAYRGFSVIREYYSPNYAIPTREKSTPDNRMTLYWLPDLFISNVDPKIPFVFYNNDRTKSFKIVVQGMTIDGKLLFIEKTIGRKAF